MVIDNDCAAVVGPNARTRASVEVQYGVPFRPGTPGIAGDAPVATRIRSARSACVLPRSPAQPLALFQAA